MSIATTKHRLESINTDVYERIKQMIAQREVAPGSRLVQQALAKRMGTSAMPIIEALRRLERDGLVTHVPHLGSFVRETNIEDLTEIYSVRRGLECEACRAFVEHATGTDRRKLVVLNEDCNRAIAEGDIGQFLAADLALHLHIVRSCGFERLAELIDNCRIEENIFAKAPEWCQPDATAGLGNVHDSIVNAIISGDEDLAAQEMRRHLMDAEQKYRDVAGCKSRTASLTPIQLYSLKNNSR